MRRLSNYHRLDNGLSPDRRQAIIWTNAGILLIRPLGTNFSGILIEIHTFSFKKMHLKMSSTKRRPFCLGLNVLSVRIVMSSLHHDMLVLWFRRRVHIVRYWGHSRSWTKSYEYTYYNFKEDLVVCFMHIWRAFMVVQCISSDSVFVSIYKTMLHLLISSLLDFRLLFVLIIQKIHLFNDTRAHAGTLMISISLLIESAKTTSI